MLSHVCIAIGKLITATAVYVAFNFVFNYYINVKKTFYQCNPRQNSFAHSADLCKLQLLITTIIQEGNRKLKATLTVVVVYIKLQWKHENNSF